MLTESEISSETLSRNSPGQNTEVTATDLEIRPNDQKIALNFVVGGFAQFAGQVDYISLRDDLLILGSG